MVVVSSSVVVVVVGRGRSWHGGRGRCGGVVVVVVGRWWWWEAWWCGRRGSGGGHGSLGAHRVRFGRGSTDTSGDLLTLSFGFSHLFGFALSAVRLAATTFASFGSPFAQ